MRTTIEISDEQYVALRTLAAQRGLRGFSPLIRDAIELLLAGDENDQVAEALGLAGTLDDEEGDRLASRFTELRGRPGRISPDHVPTR
ncbi:MAG: ribbon-helix-helix protein, CopG family [Euzebya sp.]